MKALDSSVVVAALLGWHDAHQPARRAAAGNAIPSHALVETYSVLTRLPAPHRLPSEVAGELLAAWFPPARVMTTGDEIGTSIVARLVAAGISGGASYDGVVALTAAHHDLELLTRDERAATTYEALGVRYEIVA